MRDPPAAAARGSIAAAGSFAVTADMISIRDIRTGDRDALRRINGESARDVALLEVETMQAVAATASVAWVALARGTIAGYLICTAGAL